jgi:hypothetical protein
MMTINISEYKNNNQIMSELFNTLSINKLIRLYQESQIENKRNNRLTAEVGSSRERDLIAYIMYQLQEKYKIDYKINNEYEEDIIINDTKISIKHSSNKTNSKSSIKVSWTQHKESKDKIMNNFVFKCDLIIIYVRMKEIQCGSIEVLYFTKSNLNELKQQSKNIFKTRDTSNGRGIEFHPEFFKIMLNNVDYHCKIEYEETNTSEEIDCISRRLHMLNS